MGVVQWICGGDERLTISISILSEEHMAPAFELATEVFVESSTLHQALGISLEEYRIYLRPSFEACVSEEFSIVATEPATGEVIGCLIATDFRQHLNAANTATGKFAPLAALTTELCRQYKSKRTIDPGDALLIDMGAVRPSTAGMGIYQKMRDAAQINAKEAGYKTVVGELSSASTQHVVLNKFGHAKLAEVKFAEFEIDGKFPFAKITEPNSIILVEGNL
ncbi:MAG: hypothetical protein QNJ29_07875 [Rhizobiaceae bacterium]|nr:hypothetical protein [Rhizobiaceae bacterium]